MPHDPNVVYTVNELRNLWEEYHQFVHPAINIPCDQLTDDGNCTVNGFLRHLETGLMPTPQDEEEDVDEFGCQSCGGPHYTNHCPSLLDNESELL